VMRVTNGATSERKVSPTISAITANVATSTQINRPSRMRLSSAWVGIVPATPTSASLGWLIDVAYWRATRSWALSPRVGSVNR
jgi:hypothetical protein